MHVTLTESAIAQFNIQIRIQPFEHTVTQYSAWVVNEE